MNFELPEEYQMLQELVSKFVTNELLPLESQILEREAQGQEVSLTKEELLPLNKKCKELDLWGLDAPEKTGGANLPALAMVGVNEEIGRTIVPFTFPPDSPNLHMLLATVNDYQYKRFFEPYARGETSSAIAISEPGAGADPSGMLTRATKEGREWVINGRKIWVSRVPQSAFTITMAVTDPDKGRNGISAFIVEKGTPGFKIEREIPMWGGQRTYELVYENCRIPENHLLGELGKGFDPMQFRLNVRRLQMGAWCVGMAQRALDMICDYAPQRVTFGVPLSERQAVQWWVADADTKIHACRLMVQHAAWRQDRGEDIRTAASMIKVYGTEMASEVIDNAMQTFGGMGMTKELPLQLMAQKVRTMRVYEGPSEVHRWVVARRLLRR